MVAIPRLEIESTRQERIEQVFRVLIILAALATLPLTAAYWFEWEHWAITVGDWVVWSVFVLEYGFFMAISHDRWQTTKKMWLSAAIVVLSFPLLHELFKTTRLIRLVRPIPLLRQSVVIQQIQLFRLSNIRSAGSQEGWEVAKEKLDEDHFVVRWMKWFERTKSRVINKLWPWSKAKQDDHNPEDKRSK